MMEAGKSYGLAMISSNYGGGGTFRPWINCRGNNGDHEPTCILPEWNMPGSSGLQWSVYGHTDIP